MKTKSLTYALWVNITCCTIVALLAGLPALSQLNYVAAKGNNSTQQNKFAFSIRNYYDAIAKTNLQPTANRVAYVTAPAPTVEAKKEDVITILPVKTKTERIITENTRARISENIEINFKSTSFAYPKNSREDVGISQYAENQLLLYATALKQYAIKNGFDTAYAFLSNMAMRCNKKRFFVINLMTMKIEQSGLVSHGRGQGTSVFDKEYSNRSGSKCTSLGRYKILSKYKGSYGEAYRIAGLDSSNQNAYSRNIVLHSMGCIPDQDGFMPACVSEGCPAVSPRFLASLTRIIDSRTKPVLMWIFDSNLEEPVVKEKFKGTTAPANARPRLHQCMFHPAEKVEIF